MSLLIANSSFKAFDTWLRFQEEFTYIVDAANIAYYKQNFDEGKFTFSQVTNCINCMLTSTLTFMKFASRLTSMMLTYNVQIDLIIEKLKLRGGKVLILISECYTRKIIPNSISSKRNGTSSVKGTNNVTAEDEVTLLISLC
jgi:hypothetical protein